MVDDEEEDMEGLIDRQPVRLHVTKDRHSPNQSMNSDHPTSPATPNPLHIPPPEVVRQSPLAGQRDSYAQP